LQPNYQLPAILPLPWWPFDKLKVLSKAEGERTEERGISYHPPLKSPPIKGGE